MDDIIIVLSDGKFQVSRVTEKAFVGKNIIYVGIWIKGDDRMTYNMVYRDGGTDPIRVKRFQVTAVTRDKVYDLTRGIPKSKILYFTANPNGEAEKIKLFPKSTGKSGTLKFDYDFTECLIKARTAAGNLLTKHSLSKIEILEKGISTLSARKIWFDSSVNRLNSDESGVLLGEFIGDDKILHIASSGYYRLTDFDLATKIDEDTLILEKWNPNKPITSVYWDGHKSQFFIKRFLVELVTRRILFISDHKKSYVDVVTSDWRPVVDITFDKRVNDRPVRRIDVESFIDVKTYKALGNRLSKYIIKSIDFADSLPYDQETIEPNDADASDDSSTHGSQTSLF